MDTGHTIRLELELRLCLVIKIVSSRVENEPWRAMCREWRDVLHMARSKEHAVCRPITRNSHSKGGNGLPKAPRDMSKTQAKLFITSPGIYRPLTD